MPYLVTGPVTITAVDPLEVDKWTTAIAEINNRDGSLIVNNGIASKGITLFLCQQKDAHCKLISNYNFLQQ